MGPERGAAGQGAAGVPGRIAGFAWTATLAAASAFASATGPELLPGEPAGTPVAWVRCVASKETFQGQPYWWLGDQALKVVLTNPPPGALTLALRWGAKNDRRTARLEVEGRRLDLAGGGFEGFRWLRVALPTTAPRAQLEFALAPTGAERPAFLTELRVLADGPPAGSLPELTRPAFNLAVTPLPPAVRQPAGEAFPAMRAQWDRVPAQVPALGEPAAFREAEANARMAAEAFYRCQRYVEGWLAHADPASGLIPRNLRAGGDFWNGRDAGADNYAFMVLTTALTDPGLFHGRMRDLLAAEQRLTARRDRLSDDYAFATRTWRREPFDLEATIFDSAEYVKDGLIPITEWLGPSPWSDRAIALVDDIWKNAAVATPAGPIPTLNFEVNGDLLQACARLFWFTGERKYLDWATRLGDYYLLGTHHPTRDLDTLRLRDHGGEVVNGLTELYLALQHTQPAKAAAYRPALHAIFDTILELGRNPHGLLYDWIKPGTRDHATGLCDTWGYIYDGLYTLHLVDRVEAYRAPVLEALGHLEAHYTQYPWEGTSADGYADTIESALNLFNREPSPSVARWLESETRVMWAKQQPDGIIEGWHGDGNFARTSLMIALWKTQGLHLEPWRADVRVGAVRVAGRLYVSLAADAAWTGRLRFDRPRHREYLHLPLDYPRINQFPEWFTVPVEGRYRIEGLEDRASRPVAAAELRAGLEVSVPAGSERRLTVTELPSLR